jgi:Flp pilus assembly protein TadD
MRHGQVAEAVEELRRALALEPASALAWANLSAALRQAGQKAGAVEAARRAAALDPGSAAVQGVLEEALRMPGP